MPSTTEQKPVVVNDIRFLDAIRNLALLWSKSDDDDEKVLGVSLAKELKNAESITIARHDAEQEATASE